MKHRIYSILALVLFVLTGCVETEVWNKIDDDKNKVRLSVRTMSGVVSRAADTPSEERIDWIDVFVFNSDADQTLFHKERIDMSSAPISKTGEVSLSKKRDFFVKGTSYNMYVVANASANLSENENIKKWSDLLALVQTDHNLQYSAFVDEEGEPAFAESPSRFLMDGFAFTSTDAPAQMQSFVINDDSEELLLKTTLYRAAAKFVIHIKPGDKVEFQKEIVGKTPQYYINQLPVSTKVLRPVAEDYYQPTTQNTPTTGLNDYTFTWNDDKSLTIIGYGYADDWSKLEYTKQTSMVFNIPMNWDKDKNAENGKEAESADNWYKIPLSKTKKFERNTYYQIDIIVNAVGAEEREYALELKDIEYTTQPWVEKGMNIGDYSAAFLTLNTDLVKIYDKNIDTDQLTFTSSSPIKSIKLKDVYAHNLMNDKIEEVGSKVSDSGDNQASVVEDGFYAYYVDKFGQKNQLGTDPGFDIIDFDHPGWTKDQILSKELNLWDAKKMDNNGNLLYDDNNQTISKDSKDQYIHAEVWEGQERSLNGNITIHSPIYAISDNEDLDWNSHFNTIRYLEFEVENEQGITAVFRVEQSPITVIDNVEGFFSYRSDFQIENDVVYHNPDDWYSPIDFYDKSSSIPNSERPMQEHTYGKTTLPVRNNISHLLNPAVPMFSLSGFHAYHEDKVNEDGIFLTSSCTNGARYDFEEILYGGMPRVYYRTYGNESSGTFHRGHYYYNKNGALDHYYQSSIWKGPKYQNSGAYKGLYYYYSNASNYYIAIGPKFQSGENYFRRHYTGNLFETFQAKFVRQVYKDDDENRTMPVVEEFWYCPTCTKSKSINPTGVYVSVKDCSNPTAHKMSFYNGYYDTGRTKRIVKGMGEIYRLMGSGEGDEWSIFTSLNPMILNPLTSANDTEWTINRTMVPGAVLHNHRMYHVRVTSTSDEYIIANPQMMDENGNLISDRDRGFTMEGDINARIVSPSFMIASELGETIIPQDEAHYVMPGIKTIYDLARKQCREYVETRYVDDDNSGGYSPGDRVYHYTDWRLPTRAEIEYIIKHQESSRAMDKVLGAQFYFHASLKFGQYNEQTLISDQIPNYDEALKGWYMRCVRDAYNEPEPVKYYNGIPSVLQK